MVGTLAVMGRPRKHEDTETTRLAKSLMRKIRTIVNHTDQSVPDFIHEQLIPIVERKYLETVAKMAKESGLSDDRPRRKPPAD
jgi:hypothetical protein